MEWFLFNGTEWPFESEPKKLEQYLVQKSKITYIREFGEQAILQLSTGTLLKVDKSLNTIMKALATAEAKLPEYEWDITG